MAQLIDTYPEYRVWKDMRNRCMNPNNSNYKNYGGRGIKVCERWNDFKTFLSDVGERPSYKHQLDRIDNNGNYEPSNCRWATQLEQANNKRNNTSLTYQGRTQTIPQWAREVGMKSATLRARLFVYKLSPEDALNREVSVLAAPNSPAAINFKKKYCLRGHEFNEYNTYVRPDRRNFSRDCRKCMKIRNKNRKEG